MSLVAFLMFLWWGHLYARPVLDYTSRSLAPRFARRSSGGLLCHPFGLDPLEFRGVFIPRHFSMFDGTDGDGDIWEGYKTKLERA